MILALDNSWAICTPKKTGSQSLGVALSSVGEVAPDPHATEWDGVGRRLLVVRHPYDRLNSMFWFQLAEGCTPFGVRPDPAVWMERFLALRPQSWKAGLSEWLLTQSEIASRFRPESVLRFEDGLGRIARWAGVERDVPHVNRTARKGLMPTPFEETFARVAASAREALDALFLPDMRAWYGDLLR